MFLYFRHKAGWIGKRRGDLENLRRDENYSYAHKVLKELISICFKIITDM